jgi:hypothetical protein
MKRLTSGVLLILAATAAHAQFSRPLGSRRYYMTPRIRSAATPDTAALSVAGAMRIADYGGRGIIEVPAARLAQLEAWAARFDVDLAPLDDRIKLPGVVIDPETHPAWLLAKASDLYLVQFTAPPLPEWQDEMRKLGVEVIERFPERTILVRLPPAARAALRTRSYVQFIAPHLASYKFSPTRRYEGAHVYRVQFAPIAAAGPDIATVKNMTLNYADELDTEMTHIAHFTSTADIAQAIVALPLVLGVENAFAPSQSDERQSLALTGALGAVWGVDYAAWLSTRGVTKEGLAASNVVVNVVDTGIDVGCTQESSTAFDVPRHPDLGGKVVFWHNYATEQNVPLYTALDRSGHGTVVASMIGGTAATGLRDEWPYLRYGLGSAPGVRLGATKIVAADSSPSTNLPLGSISTWTDAAIAASCQARSGTDCILVTPAPALSCNSLISNHSYNDYPTYQWDNSTDGAYTANSVAYDAVVRAKGVTMVFAAGNFQDRTALDGPNPRSCVLGSSVVAPATAKNVITVGAAETARESQTPLICPNKPADCVAQDLTFRHYAQGYSAVAYVSRRGTLDGRFKPDIIAPGTSCFGAWSRALINTGLPPDMQTPPFCAGTVDALYTGASGTSFAAPVVTGAAAVLSYWYQQRGLTPTPAMMKAMLVANAHSMKMATDHQTGQVVGHAPSTPQGFGLARIDQLLDTALAKYWFESPPVEIYTTWTRTLEVADPTKPVVAVLAWTDPPGAVNAGVR